LTILEEAGPFGRETASIKNFKSQRGLMKGNPKQLRYPRSDCAHFFSSVPQNQGQRRGRFMQARRYHPFKN
jgi:hypothetical protein